MPLFPVSVPLRLRVSTLTLASSRGAPILTRRGGEAQEALRIYTLACNPLSYPKRAYAVWWMGDVAAGGGVFFRREGEFGGIDCV